MTDSIQVAIRVRPLIAREKQKNECKLWKVDENTVYQKSSPSEKFSFDRVFDTNEDNFSVYSDLCMPIVQSVMQGFNGTILAYGQTSSGKTFTMTGEHNGILKGIVHYSVEDVFRYIQEMPDRDFLLRVSFLEIYNEKVYDLLSDKNEDLKILEDGYGNIKVNGLEEKIVQREVQIWQLMKKCEKKKRMGETKMNQASSRSHTIFRMIIESRVKDEDAAVVNVSQLNLVDLAGSENLKQINAKGERFKEGVHINLSLSTLIQVISQLSEKDENQFINYRNSKITRLLQNSLGGNALTAIICAVTPASLHETRHTINFASRAKKIKNKPTKNEILNDQALLKQYANQIKKLSEELQVTKEQGKELEEKTKQNENLRRQIEALKANFVSQTGKTNNRRETWGGHLDARYMRFTMSNPVCTPHPSLGTVEEETEGDSMISECFNMSSRKNRSSVIKFRLSDNVFNAETQTEIVGGLEYPEYKESMEIISDLKCQLVSLQSELKELQVFTSYEKQCLKAGSELNLENEDLKKENTLLKEHLDSVVKEWCDKQNLNSSLEINVLSSPKKTFPKESQTSPLKPDDDIDYLNEQIIKLKQDNEELSSKILKLETSCHEQSEAYQIAQCEWKAKSQKEIEEIESKYQKEITEIHRQLNELKDLQDKYHELEEYNNELKQKLYNSDLHLKQLQEKYSELEECDRNLKQKLSDSEAEHYNEVQSVEAKYEAAQSKLLLMARDQDSCKKEKHLQDKYHELEEYNNELKQKLSNSDLLLKQLQEKYSELEECDRDLKQKLSDSEAEHHIEVQSIKAKYKASQSELLSMAGDLDLCKKELAKIKYQLERHESFVSNDETCLKEQNVELEACNQNLKQQLCDLETTYSIKLKATEEKCAKAEANLLSLTKELEAYQKSLTDVKHKLEEMENEKKDMQEKFTKLIDYNNDLRKKNTDLEDAHYAEILELEKQFQAERSEWEDYHRKTVADLQESQLQELKEQDKFTQDFYLQLFKEKVEVYTIEIAELKDEVADLKSQNLDLTTTKESYLEKIKELQKQNTDQISDIVKKNKEELLACMAKYEKTIAEYINRQRQTRDINRQLKNQINSCKEENENLKKKIASMDDSQHLEDKITELTIQRDNLHDKYSSAEKEIYKLKDKYKQLQIEFDKQINIVKESNSREAECIKLNFELDQKKAKIISLETNNERLIQEVKKQKEKFSSKQVPCKCEMNIKKTSKEIQPSEDLKQTENEKLDGGTNTNVKKIYSTKHTANDNVIPMENDVNENGDQNRQVEVCNVPPNMMKCYYLEQKLYKKEKETKKLVEENAKLKTELTTIKARPVIIEQKKPAMEKCYVQTPVSPLKELNEDITVKMYSMPPKYSEAAPKKLEKQPIVERKRNHRPHKCPPENIEPKYLCEYPNEQLNTNAKENRPLTKEDGYKIMRGEMEPPDCKQQ